MPEKPGGELLEREDMGDVTVLRVRAPMLQGDGPTDDLFQQITAVVEDGGRQCLVLNLAAVEYLASRALGKLVLLSRKVREAKGRVALCQPTQTVDRLLEATHLAEIIPVYRDERQALLSFV
jgi:anti-anti-sigma factor